MRKLRKTREKADKEELQRIMEDMDLTWEQRKDMEREQADKKRSRTMDIEEEVKVTQRKHKKMRFSKVEDNWGEEDRDEGEGDAVEDRGIVEIVPKPRKHLYSRGTLTTVITDYFTVVRTPEISVRMEDNKDEALLWEENEEEKMWFEEYTSVWADLTNPGGRLVGGEKYTSLNYEATSRDQSLRTEVLGDEDQEESAIQRDEDQEHPVKKPCLVEGEKYTSLNYEATTRDQNLRDGLGNKDQESGIQRDEDQEHPVKKPLSVEGVKYTSLNYEATMRDQNLKDRLRDDDQEAPVVQRGGDQEYMVKKTLTVEGVQYTSLNYEATMEDQSLRDGVGNDDQVTHGILRKEGDQTHGILREEEDQDCIIHRGGDQTSRAAQLFVRKDSTTTMGDQEHNYVMNSVKEDDNNKEMEDDWGEIDQDELLLITKNLDPGYDQDQPKLEKGHSTTSTPIHHEVGREDSSREVFPRVGDQHTTTQVREGLVTDSVDYHWSTAMFKHWDEISDEQKDRAFELWTSPVTVKVPDIVKAVCLKYDEGTDKHTGKISPVSQDETIKQSYDISTEEPSSGQLGTQTTGKAVS